MDSRFKGIFSILLTPFKEDGSVDLGGLEHLIERNVQGGVHGVVVLGSNGEFPYVSLETKKAIIRTAAAVVRKRTVLVCGTSSAYTKQAIELSAFAEENGADGLMIIIPCYYPLPFKEVVAHYQAITNRVKVPVLYYNYPELSGVKLTVGQFKEMLSLPGIIGAKNSDINPGYFKKLLAECEGMGKSIFTGAEFNLATAYGWGAVGSLGPLANIWPEKLTELFKALEEKRDADAAKAQLELFCLMPLMGAPIMTERAAQKSFKLASSFLVRPFRQSKPTMAMLKEALRQLGVPITAKVRSPIPQLTKDDQVIVEKVLARMKEIQKKGIRN